MTVADIAATPVLGGIAAPAGFRAAGVACGIKKRRPRPRACWSRTRRRPAAAVFTTNKAQAAPVLVSKAHVAHRRRPHARAWSRSTAAAPTRARARTVWTPRVRWPRRQRAVAGCDPTDVLVASTGVIGVTLDRASVVDGIKKASTALSRDGGALAARAIMTTDPFPKEVSVEVTTAGGRFRVGGMAKGSGMIEPMMATMLAVVTTDAQVDPGAAAAGAVDGDGGDVQRDLGGRRVLDERLCVRARVTAPAAWL